MSSRRRTLFTALVFLVLLCCLYTVNRPLLSTIPGNAPAIPSSNANKPRWSYRKSFVEVGSLSDTRSAGTQGYVGQEGFGVHRNQVIGEGRNKTFISQDQLFVTGEQSRNDLKVTVRRVTSTESVGKEAGPALHPAATEPFNFFAAEGQSFHEPTSTRQHTSVGKVLRGEIPDVFSGGHGRYETSNSVRRADEGRSAGVHKEEEVEEKSSDVQVSSRFENTRNSHPLGEIIPAKKNDASSFLPSGKSFTSSIGSSSLMSSASGDKSPLTLYYSQVHDILSPRGEYQTDFINSNVKFSAENNRSRLLLSSGESIDHLPPGEEQRLLRSMPLNTISSVAGPSTTDSLEEEYGDESYANARHDSYDGTESMSDDGVVRYREKGTLVPAVVERRVNESQGERQLPDALIIGAKKCGTRALLEFLRLHPRVRAARQELHFFDRHFHRGLRWYRQKLPPRLPGELTVEKTPAYFVSPQVPGRVRSLVPGVYLLLVVREPATRALSDYTQGVSKRNGSRRTFTDQVFSDRATGLVNVNWGPVSGGLYARHLQRWLHYFPPSRLHVVDGDRLVAQPAAEMRRVEKFLKLPPFIAPQHFYFNKTKGFPCIVRYPSGDPVVPFINTTKYKSPHEDPLHPGPARRSPESEKSPPTAAAGEETSERRALGNGAYPLERRPGNASPPSHNYAFKSTNSRPAASLHATTKSHEGHNTSSVDAHTRPSSASYGPGSGSEPAPKTGYRMAESALNSSLHPRCLGSSKGREHPDVDQETFKILQEFYRPFNHKFFRIIQRKFNWG